MQITHTVKLQGPQQYEMVYFTMTFSIDDLPEALKNEVRLSDCCHILQYMVQREVVNLMLQSGHLTLEVAQGKIEWLRQCLGEPINMVVKYGL